MSGYYSGYLVKPDIVPGWWEFKRTFTVRREVGTSKVESMASLRGKDKGRIKMMTQARGRRA